MIQLLDDYLQPNQLNKISMGINPNDGAIVSCRINNEEKKPPFIPADKVAILEAYSRTLSPETIKILRKIQSDELVDLGNNILDRQGFMNNDYDAPPAILSYSEEVVPTEIIARLTHEKKNNALGVKYELGDRITNMEGALHTFLNPIERIEMTGDLDWMGAANGVYGKNFGDNKGRQVVLSALVQPDFENTQVLMQIAELQEKSIQGKPLPADYKFPDQDENWSGAGGGKKRKDYDMKLQEHMIYHLTAGHSLPSKNAVGKPKTWEEGVEFLETLIDPKKTQGEIIQALKNEAVILNGHTISLEVMFHVYLEQVKNEMRVLEAGLPQGYVYTSNPPKIFIDALGKPETAGRVFNRLQALAFMCVNNKTPLENMKVFAFASFADQDMIQQLRKALPGKAVIPRGKLFKGQKDDNTYLENASLSGPLKTLCKGAALVLHNNSDAFGQNIETEGNSSLDGVIGSCSSGYRIVARERNDYDLIGKKCAYTPLDSKAKVKGHFHPVLFAGALALEADEINQSFDQLADGVKLKMVKKMFEEMHHGLQDKDRKEFEEFYYTPMKIVQGDEILTKDHVENFCNFLEQDPDVLINSGVLTPNSPVQNQFKKDLLNYILKDSKVGSMLPAVHAVAQGMKAVSHPGVCR